MEWFTQKTSIAGVQVSNWMIVLGATIVVLLIVQNFH
jgi:type IV secretory pathway VirB3-like protein